jgi:HEPN domain-containing protein
MKLRIQGKSFMKKQSKNWLDAAKDDLLVINEIIENEYLTHMTAFHSQQAIEKSIKAIFEEKEAKVPEIHDLLSLKNKIDKYINLNFDQEIFDQINELYIDTRYPTDLGLLPGGKPSMKVAAEFFNTATKIFDDIKKYLGDKGT